MWGILIGLALGTFQVVVLRKSVEMMTKSKSNIGLGVMISVGKLALILLVLWALMRYAGMEVMLWCAGGIAAAMIGIPVFRSVSTIRKYKREEQEQQEEK